MGIENDYLQTFCRLSEAFGTTGTVDELLQLIVKSATETMSARASCLFMADQKQDVFVPMAQYGLSDNYLHANPLKAKKVIAALKKSGHLVFEDALSDPRLEHHEIKRAEGIASILTVPVMVKNRCIGVLSLYTAKRHTFGDEEIVFLKALAANGGVALEKARLLERIERNALLFLDLASDINSSLEITEVLHSLSEKTCKMLGMKGITIRLLDEERNTLELVASYGLSEEFLNKGIVLAQKSITDVMEGRTVILENLAEEKRLQYPQETEKEGIKSMVCVPIRSKEKVIGVMRLYSQFIRKYPRDFIMVVEALAHTGALAIRNASLYLALKEDKKSLEEDIWSHRLYF